MDCGLPGFSIDGILQARILEWVAVPFSRGSSQTRDRTQVSYIAGRFFTAWERGWAGVREGCWGVSLLQEPGSRQLRCGLAEADALGSGHLWVPSISSLFSSKLQELSLGREWLCHSLLLGIFPTQGLNPGLLHCRPVLYLLSPTAGPY